MMNMDNNLNSLNTNIIINKNNLERKYKHNVDLDYIFCFLKNFDISSAIWVLYMVYKGLPLWQIGVVEGIFHVCSFLFEVPSGAIADLFGRKKTIIAGRVLSIISAVVNLFADNIFLFSISFAISALSYNLNSGSEEALVYDSLKEINEEDKYIKVNSKLNMIIEVAQGLGTFAGGILAEKSYIVCYLTVILISLISLIPAFLFTEPLLSKNLYTKKHNTSSLLDFKNNTIISHFKICIKILKTQKDIFKILIFFPLIETFNTVVFFYGQQYFNILGFNKIQISLIMLFSSLLCCLGAFASEKMIILFKDKAKYIASLIMAISIIILSLNNTILSIMFFGIMNFSNSILYPIQSTSLNKLIPSEQRATIISISSMMFSLAMVIFFPVSGLIADIFDLHLTFMLLGIIQIMLLFILSRKIK